MEESDYQINIPTLQEMENYNKVMNDAVGDGVLRNFHHLNLYVGGGVNRAYFCFTSF